MKENELKTDRDDTFRETRKHGGGDFSFGYYEENVFRFDFRCIDWHWHYETEIVFAEKGRIVCCVGTEKFILPQGCGLFVNSGVLHRYEATEDVSMPNIVFSPDISGNAYGRIFAKYIKPLIDFGAEYRILNPDVAWQREALEILRRIFAEQKTENPSELQTFRLLLDLWSVFYENLPVRTEGAGQRKEIRRKTLLQLMLQYIHANYGGKISLSDIAAAAYVGKNGALRIFKEGVRTSPVAYLIRYRLARAADLLATTDETVADVAEKTGFESPGYFCRKFRELYRLSPLGYREKTASEKTEEKTEGGVLCQNTIR